MARTAGASDYSSRSVYGGRGRVDAAAPGSRVLQCPASGRPATVRRAPAGPSTLSGTSGHGSCDVRRDPTLRGLPALRARHRPVRSRRAFPRRAARVTALEETLCARASCAAALAAAGHRARDRCRRRPGRRRERADAVRAVLRQEPDPVRQLQVAHLHDRPLRDLLLPRDRAAPRAGRRLRRERLPAGQLRPEARPGVQGAADPVQDAAASSSSRTSSRARRRKASARSPSRRATAWCCRSTSRRTCSTASSSHELTHIFEFDIIPHVADPPQHAAVGGRGAVGLHDAATGARST